MTLPELESQVETGAIDTVIVAFPDPFGRLVGKRCTAAHFLESVVTDGTHGCSYLLTVNLDMDPLDGFAVANWEAGFGDFALRIDPSTLCVLPWQTATALVLCDCGRHDGTRVAEAPRSVLRAQVERLDDAGLECRCASELEFYLFNQTFHEAFASGYRDLRPSSDYRIDYHILQPTRDEALMRAIRNGMTAAGIPIESSKGEWSRGQHEINFRYTTPLAMADRHTIFKHGVKEMAEQAGKSVSFMAKYAASEAGSSCHLHLSLWKDGVNAFWVPAASKGRRTSRGQHTAAHGSGSPVFRQFLGGLLAYSRELSLLFAPTVNSYKRYQPGSWAPTRLAWSTDNRTTGFRNVGHDTSYRIEHRMPGADANPYLAFAAMLAAGLAGVEQGLDCGEAYRGNAYVDEGLARVPASLLEATDLFEASALARTAFGDAVVDFYVRHARIEQQAFSDAVTDWERARYFERI
jgi:glutamine synthetase